MIAHVLPQDSTDKSITWSVEPKGIGTISNNGLLTALAEGIANVIAENEFSGVSGISKIGMKFSSLPDPPELIPDTTDNDMMHPIEISFEPMKIWTDNIEQIKVENTQDRVLDESQYEINDDSGKITIKNVEYADNGMPVYTGILDVADNTIIVKAREFEDAEVNQVIKPNQIIDVVHGSGDGIFRVCRIGDYIIRAKVISPGENSEIEINNSINITMVKVIPSYGEKNVQLDVLLQVIFNKELRLINIEDISIKDSNDIEVGNIEVYLSDDNKVIEIRHDDFEPRKEYTVNIPRGAVEYVNGILDKGITWPFET
nr:Ig-like domain-containing protein [Oceanirhabdus seepicola]